MVIYQTELCNLANKEHADFFYSLLKKCAIVDGGTLEDFLQARQLGINILEEKAKIAPSNVNKIKGYFCFNARIYPLELCL
jgi:hypothetical protein